MEDDETCMLGLSLELGLGGYVPKMEKQKVNKQDLTFEIYPKGKVIDVDRDDKAEEGFRLNREHEKHPHPNQKNTENTNRKKLRLTKEQQAMLEDSFKLHNNINSAQKQALAEQLNLKHAQVKVWFKNKRARTKVKQTEVDCEILKKWCEELSEENLRLMKELQELRALKIGPSIMHTQVMADNWTICSSCKELLNSNELKEKTTIGNCRGT